MYIETNNYIFIVILILKMNSFRTSLKIKKYNRYILNRIDHLLKVILFCRKCDNINE